MEIALGICAILMLNVFYYAALKGIDYSEKGNNKKTYSIGFWKYVMIRYTKEIEATREEEIAKRKTKRENDTVNASTISRLSFWLHILNFLFVAIVIVLGILDVVLQTESLNYTVKILRIIFVSLIPILVVFSIVKSEMMLSKRQ